MIGALVVAMLAVSCGADSRYSKPASTSEPVAQETPTTEVAASEADGSGAGGPNTDVATSDQGPIVEPDPDDTPIDRDEAVRVGLLDNGLSYYVQSNDSPGQQLQLWLVVAAGDVEEEVPGDGVAHFAEHMLFNGTEAFPGNELDRILQGFGLQIGPDTNAYTAFDETVYSLAVPSVAQDAIDTAFDIVHEWAAAATIDADAVVDEVGVVREEFRLRRESADGVILERFLDIYTADSTYAGRRTSEEQIESTVPDAVRSFYDRWYRPEFMAVVAVGDLPTDLLEKMVIDRFSDLEGRGPAPDVVVPVAPPITERAIEVIRHPEGPEPFISLDFALPNWDPGTVGGERLLMTEEVIAGIIGNRLSDASARGSLPIVRPFVGMFPVTRSRRFLGFNFVGEDEAAALQSVLAELARVERTGFQSNEVDRAAGEIQAGLDQWLSSIGTRQDADLATAFAEHFLSGAEIDSPESSHGRLTSVLEGLSVAEVTNHYRYVMSRTAPLVAVVGDQEADLPTVAELTAAVDGAEAVASVNREVADESPVEVGSLMDAPDPTKELDRRVNDDLDATELVFENGVRLVMAPSSIVEGHVDMLSVAQGGHSLLEPGDGPYAELAAFAVSRSGVGDLDSVDLDRALVGSVVSLSPYIADVSEGFSGSASSDDVELLFQLLHLSIAEPRVDDAGWREALERGRSLIRDFETNPRSAAFEELVDARFQGSEYLVVAPESDRLEAMDAQDALELYVQRLGAVDDLVVALVGDFDAAEIHDLARRYLGTLRAGPADSWVDNAPPPPSGVVTRTVGAGENAAGAGFDLLFSLEIEVDDEIGAELLILQTALQTRLFEIVREELAASYTGGNVSISVVDAPDKYLEAFVTISADPERLDEVHERVLEEIEDVATNGLSDDEFQRAQSVVTGDLEFINNFDLLDELLSWAIAPPALQRTLIGRYLAANDVLRSRVEGLAAKLFTIDERVEVFRSADG